MSVKASYGHFNDSAGSRRASPMSGKSWSYYFCDLFSDLPSVFIAEGDLAYVQENHRLYFWNGTDWKQVRY